MRDYFDTIKSMYKWINTYAAIYVNNNLYVKERYSIKNKYWYDLRRPYYMLQAASAYYNLWKHYHKNKYLLKARSLTRNSFQGINESGCFIYDLDGVDRTIYLGGNCEDVIYLCRFADIDTDKAEEYHDVARGVIEWIMSMQNTDGGWAMNGNAYTPLGTGHALAALSYYYQYIDDSKKTSVLNQIEKGVDFLIANQVDSGRFLCCAEIQSTHEYWRAPSSDHCIALRGLTMCEYFFPNNTHIQAWHNARIKALEYLYELRHESGAIVNGEYNGVSGTKLNGADFNFITDHVYTSRYAIEAFDWCYKIDGDEEELSTMYALCNFCAGNAWNETYDLNAKGVLRGAYNLRDKNWDTSMIILNPGGEGGADMVYVGSVNAPILGQLIQYNENWEEFIGVTSPIKFYDNGVIKNVLVNDEADSPLKVYYNGSIHNIVLVDSGSEHSSNWHIHINGETKCIAADVQ